MDRRLQVLFDYTKFHIGLYSAIVTALIAAMTGEHPFAAKDDHVYLCVAIGFIFVAAFAGGVIARGGDGGPGAGGHPVAGGRVTWRPSS